MAVVEAFRGQDPTDDDHRGALDARGQDLARDVAERAAQHDLAGLAGVGHDGRGAVAPVVRRQLGHDLLDPLDGQVLAAGVKRTAVIIVGKVLAAEGFRDSHLYSSARDRGSQA